MAGYMTVYSCQNSQGKKYTKPTKTLQRVNLNVYKFLKSQPEQENPRKEWRIWQMNLWLENV